MGVTSKKDASFIRPLPRKILAMPPTSVSGIFLIVRIPDLIGLTSVSICKMELQYSYVMTQRITVTYRSYYSSARYFPVIRVRLNKLSHDHEQFVDGLGMGTDYTQKFV